MGYERHSDENVDIVVNLIEAEKNRDFEILFN